MMTVESPTRYVDFNLMPATIPLGWRVLPDKDQLPDRVTGQVPFDPTKIRLHFGSKQKSRWTPWGKEVFKEFRKDSLRVCGAQMMDFLLKNQPLIPQEWEGLRPTFWGTIFGLNGYKYVASMQHLPGSYWFSSYREINTEGFTEDYPAVVMDL